MRSFVALIVCIACIAWVHSFDKRLLGVNSDASFGENQQQLPVDVVPAAVAFVPASALQQNMTPATVTNIMIPVVAVTRSKTTRLKKKRSGFIPVKDSSRYDFVVVKRPGLLMSTLTP
ncbi:hypothetical protein [Chitinophaga sp. MM2321]|uniref:hypothetical protein n=1 Tax=Chitinophaga sp. MM2321 TaxID=3137178 RepID=UPI0032D593C6